MENVLSTIAFSLLCFIFWVRGVRTTATIASKDKEKKERKTFGKRAMRYVRCDSTNIAWCSVGSIKH